MFAKIKITKIPKIIYEAFPFTTTLRHSDRYKNNLQQLISKRNYYYNSYFIKMFRERNKLDNHIKNSKSYEEFETLLDVNKIQHENYYTYDSYTDIILLSFRMKNSLLQSDKYKMGMSLTNLCNNCPSKNQETIFYYLFECPKYNYYRQKLLHDIKTIAKLKYTPHRILLQILLNNNNNTKYLQKHEFNSLSKYLRNIYKKQRDLTDCNQCLIITITRHNSFIYSAKWLSVRVMNGRENL